MDQTLLLVEADIDLDHGIGHFMIFEVDLEGMALI